MDKHSSILWKKVNILPESKGTTLCLSPPLCTSQSLFVYVYLVLSKWHSGKTLDSHYKDLGFKSHQWKTLPELIWNAIFVFATESVILALPLPLPLSLSVSNLKTEHRFSELDTPTNLSLRVCRSGSVVEHSARILKIKGSNPATEKPYQNS